MKDTIHLISPLTRGLPKTRQEVSYLSDDDGDYEAGWWIGRLNANNKERWQLHPTYPTNLVIDKATGLMWPRNGNGVGCISGATQSWDAAVSNPHTLNWCGYTDWRLPNALELASIIHFAAYNPCIDTTIFPNTKANYYWSSTTYYDNSSYAHGVRFLVPMINYAVKTTFYYVRYVRGGV